MPSRSARGEISCLCLIHHRRNYSLAVDPAHSDSARPTQLTNEYHSNGGQHERRSRSLLKIGWDRDDHVESPGQSEHSAHRSHRRNRQGPRRRQPRQSDQGRRARRRGRQLLRGVRLLWRTRAFQIHSRERIRPWDGCPLGGKSLYELHHQLHGTVARPEADDRQGPRLLRWRRFRAGTVCRSGDCLGRCTLWHALLPCVGLSSDGNVDPAPGPRQGKILRTHRRVDQRQGCSRGSS